LNKSTFQNKVLKIKTIKKKGQTCQPYQIFSLPIQSRPYSRYFFFLRSCQSGKSSSTLARSLGKCLIYLIKVLAQQYEIKAIEEV